MLAPTSPGRWVSEDQCVCGARYKDFNAGLTFEQGVTLVRAHNGGNWYPSRGPVLWALHCNKLMAWYWKHRGCGGESD